MPADRVRHDPEIQNDRVAGALQSLRRSGRIQLRDRFSFMRFLGLDLEDAVPDAKTLWLYREALARQAGGRVVFCFDGFLKDKGYLAMGGQIIDATIVSAPKQHNSREENETIKEGETPEDWKQQAGQEPPEGQGRALDEEERTLVFRLQEPYRRRSPAQIRAPLRGERRERARQSKVRRRSRCEQHGFGRVGRQRLSQRGDRGKARGECGLKSRIHRRRHRNRKLSEAQKAANTTRSKVRARVEHVFGDQKNGMGAEIVRTIGPRGAVQDRNDEPRLQHAPPRLPRKDGGCGRVSW